MISSKTAENLAQTTTPAASLLPVYLACPFRAGAHGTRELLDEYRNACVRDCLRQGEAPFPWWGYAAPAGPLADADPSDRALGMGAGLVWMAHAARFVFYVDFGVSGGMMTELDAARTITRARLASGAWRTGEGEPKRIIYRRLLDNDVGLVPVPISWDLRTELAAARCKAQQNAAAAATGKACPHPHLDLSVLRL